MSKSESQNLKALLTTEELKSRTENVFDLVTVSIRRAQRWMKNGNSRTYDPTVQNMAYQVLCSILQDGVTDPEEEEPASKEIIREVKLSEIYKDNPEIQAVIEGGQSVEEVSEESDAAASDAAESDDL